MTEPYDIWLREQAVAAHDAARAASAREERRANDLSLLADALDSFFEHPNTTTEDKAALCNALRRLLGTSP